MNEASAWRIERAREFAAPYLDQQPLLVIVTGSAAKGVADPYSDLDMMVYWDAVPADWLAAPPLQPLGVGRFSFQTTPTGGVIEQYFAGALKVDVGHVARDAWGQLIASVIDELDAAPEKQKALGGFLDAVVVHDTGSYEAWRTRIAAYPDALAQAMVRANLFFYPAWAAQRSMLDRQELVGFYDMMVATAKNLLCVLAGLNRVYFSTIEPKWIRYYLGQMSLKPERAFERIMLLFSPDRDAAVAEMPRLIADVLALVEAHLPSVDTRIARAIQAIPLNPAGPRADSERFEAPGMRPSA